MESLKKHNTSDNLCSTPKRQCCRDNGSNQQIGMVKYYGIHSYVVPVFNYKMSDCWYGQTSTFMEHGIGLENFLSSEHIELQLTYLEDELRDQMLREAYLNDLSKL